MSKAKRDESDLERLIMFLKERQARARLDALPGKGDKDYRLLVSGECIGYAVALEFIKRTFET